MIDNLCPLVECVAEDEVSEELQEQFDDFEQRSEEVKVASPENFEPQQDHECDPRAAQDDRDENDFDYDPWAEEPMQPTESSASEIEEGDLSDSEFDITAALESILDAEERSVSVVVDISPGNQHGIQPEQGLLIVSSPGEIGHQIFSARARIEAILERARRKAYS